jgi:hypothetical protein
LTKNNGAYRNYGEKYSSSGIKQAARKKANEKFEKLFTEKAE